ncbi:atherin-like [Sorghum bicolor]|uniref:atherin-like n=1 Tax=Sorghum bicolor TaxID=4558 RepID=UPI000B426C92|nr:atherin-like [Sorghum bicolor]|eukprot:XP_021321731.1 atherin-like [Sorghum bicolor]
MVSLPPLDPNASPPAASRAYAGGRTPPAASRAYAGGLASRRAAARAPPAASRAMPVAAPPTAQLPARRRPRPARREPRLRRWPRLPPRAGAHAVGCGPPAARAPPATQLLARRRPRPARCEQRLRRWPRLPPRAHAHPVGCSPPTARAAAPVAARTPWGSRIEMAVGICTGGDISTNYYTPKIPTEGKPHENSCRRNTICMNDEPCVACFT